MSTPDIVKRKMGRPKGSGYTIRTERNATLICERIAEGYSLRQIGKEIGCVKSAITDWVRDEPDFDVRYARAMELRTEHFAQEILEIADEGTNDWMEREGVFVPDHEHISRSKLRVDTRRWLMSKMLPRKYGDRVVNEHTGTDGAPIEVSVEHRQKQVLEILDRAYTKTVTEVDDG